MNRLDAFRALRAGCTISRDIVGNEVTYGKVHTYTIFLNKRYLLIRDKMMGESYRIANFTMKQAITFIRRHFPIREVRVQKDPFKEVA